MNISMEVEDVQKSLAEANKKLERQTQEIHELKQLLQTKNALEVDMKEELDTLQKELDEQQKRYGDSLAKSKSTITKEFKQKEHELQALLDEKTKLCVQQGEKIEELQLSSHKPNLNEVELSVLKSELSDCRQELDSMGQDYADLQSKHSILLARNLELNADLEEARELLHHHQQRCEDLRSSNSNLKEELEQVQEDLQSMQLEMLMLKKQAQSSEDEAKEAAAHGNSLFSEVEDNRQVAMHRLKEALQETAQTKELYEVVKLELQQLRLKYVALHDEFGKIQDLNLQYMDGELRARHEKEIQEMEKIIQELQLQAVKQAPQLLPEALAQHVWIQKMVAKHQEKENELNGKLHEMRIQLLMNESTKINCLRQERIAKAENLKIKGELLDLTSKLQSVENQQNNVSSSKANNNNERGIENIPPAAKPSSIPAFLMNRKPSQNTALKFALPASGLYKEKPKRQPYSVPTVRVPPPAQTTSQQESKPTGK